MDLAVVNCPEQEIVSPHPVSFQCQRNFSFTRLSNLSRSKMREMRNHVSLWASRLSGCLFWDSSVSLLSSRHNQYGRWYRHCRIWWGFSARRPSPLSTSRAVSDADTFGNLVADFFLTAASGKLPASSPPLPVSEPRLQWRRRQRHLRPTQLSPPPSI